MEPNNSQFYGVASAPATPPDYDLSTLGGVSGAFGEEIVRLRDLADAIRNTSNILAGSTPEKASECSSLKPVQNGLLAVLAEQLVSMRMALNAAQHEYGRLARAIRCL